jgi:hypothetical protein
MHRIILKKSSCFGGIARLAACATSAGLAYVGGGQKPGQLALLSLRSNSGSND